MAANESFEDAVAAEGDDRIIIRVWLVEVVGICLEAVIKPSGELTGIDVIKVRGRHHLAQIPEFHRLVLPVGKHVAPVTLAVNVGQALGVTHEDTSFTSITHRPSVPDPKSRVIRARIEQMRRRLVAEAYCIYVVLVAIPKVEYWLLGFDIIDDDGVF